MHAYPAAKRPARLVQVAWALLGVLFALGCDGEGPALPDGAVGDGGEGCAAHADCSDGVYCNGEERCAPDEEGADARGCIAAPDPRCQPSQECSEEEGACLSACDVDPDADGDGAIAIACGGDDCDDADPSRYPGALEICDPEGVDEDCDPTTIGAQDADEDGQVSSMCCNGERCGPDCDDTEPSVNRLSPETCNLRDDDCDGATDEGLGSTPELCNTADDDCDGRVDEGVCAPCPAGYAGFDGACTDIDECASSTACHPARVCVNAPGSYSCEACADGYLDDGPYGCADVNECLEGTDLCHSARPCLNTSGGHTCGPCAEGYSDVGLYGCENVDECATDNGGCDPLATCDDLEPGFVCVCPSNYVLGEDGLDCLYDVARLEALLASEGSVAPALQPWTDEHTVMVPAGTSSVTVTPSVAEPAGATIEVDGAVVASGTPSAPIALTDSTPVIVTIRVVAETGRERTYRVRLVWEDPNCLEAAPVILDCDSGSLRGPATVEGAARDAYCGRYDGYVGPGLIHAFRHSGSEPVHVTITATTGWDYDLFVLDGEAECAAPDATCLAQSRTPAGWEPDRVQFLAEPGATRYVAYDTVRSDPFGFVTLEVSCAPIACGDGRVSPGETCDDGALELGDGCDASCQVEPGFACAGAPSRCAASTENESCANATSITADTTVSLGQIGDGGGPVGPYCGLNPQHRARYFDVTVEPGQRVQVDLESTDPEADLFVQERCDSVGCLPSSGGRSISIANPTETAITRVVGARIGGAYFDNGITFRYFVAEGCGSGAIEPGEACDDGNADDGDGCDGACQLEPTAACVGAPSECVLGAPAHAYCAAPVAITETTTLVEERAGLGGPPLEGSSCGAGDRALYYEVTIPPGQQVGVELRNATGTNALFVAESCEASACLPLATALVNDTETSVSRLVGVRTSDSSSARFDVTFVYLPLGWAPIAAACVDTSEAEVVRLSPSPADAPLTGDTDLAYSYPLPFPFSLFGAPVGYWSPSTNGLLSLRETEGYGSVSATNLPIPRTSEPNGYVTAFWDDLVIDPGAAILHTVLGAEGSRRFVVEWRDARVKSVGGSQITFQVHLLEGSDAIELHYCAASGTEPNVTGGSATLGAESLTGALGVQAAWNEAGAAVVGSGYRLSL